MLRLAGIDTDGSLGEALGARPEAWLIRPDAHIAAVLPAPDPAIATVAVRRALALPFPAAEGTRARR